MKTATADVDLPMAPPDSRVKKAPSASFTSNLVAVLGGQVSCSAVALILQACYARFLGPAGRGQISLCLMAAWLGVLLGGLGIEYPLALWTADSKEKSSQWLPAVFLGGILGSTVACCLWTAVYWKWHPAFLKGMTPGMALIVLPSIPLCISVTYLMSILAGLERFRLRSGLALSNQAMGLLGMVLLVLLFGRKPEVALLGNQLGLLIGFLVTAFILRDFLGGAWNLRAAGHRFYPAVRLATRGQLGNLATFFNYRLDVFIVNYYLDPAQVGLYAVGVLVAEALWHIPNAVAVTLFPRTVRTLDAGAAEFTCFVLRQVLLIACICGVALALLSPVLVPLVFGARFTPSVPVIWLILPGVIALSLAKVICADLAARGKPEFSSIFAVVALVVTVVLDLLLIPRMGIKGAAIASSATYIVQTTLLAIALKHQLKVPWKSFFIPTSSERVAYQLAWFRLKSRFWPAPAPGLGRVD
ncbi:MAG TPA: polysaccharide biosynthesis C-terminal domain-containing protein [Candidatus Acidoferrum sp.]|nr:polysaccharide biosynthesis C-terminal domain-containing protein [Candidatus Acidoferrum sp.]